MSKKTVFDDLWPWLVCLGQVYHGMRAERNYQALPEVLPVHEDFSLSQQKWPGISLIVPARNEERNLPTLLSSLVEQHYPLYEIVVVDDASTDKTAAIVGSYASRGVHLLHSDGPPPGWTGKNHACWSGANESRHPWLLFVDADTALSPVALRSVLAYALAHDLKAMSLFARQRCEGFWERALLPLAYQQYFVGVQAQRVNASDGAALANGQFLLVRRDVYRDVGGHAAQAESVIDDVALATRLKAMGVTSLACRGEQLVSVRMYTSLREIAEGFGKNAYLFLRQAPFTGVQTALSTSLAASVLPLFVEGIQKRSLKRTVLATLAYFAQLQGLRSWTRRFGVSPLYTLFTPVAAVVFLGIALRSMVRVLTGRSLAWKGRSYRAHTQRPVRYRLPRQWIMEMGQAIVMKKPRSIMQDSALAVRALPHVPHLSGVEQLPAQGSFVLLANHYQRFDLWIGWSGALLIDAVAQQRAMPVHVVTTDRARIGRFTVPGTRWLIERVAGVWDLIPVTPPAVAREHREKTHYTLLRIMRLLRRADGASVCILLMPEGDEGNTDGLIDAMPESGRALYALSRLGLPLVPAAVWEEDGVLHASFGKPFSLAALPLTLSTQEIDMQARALVMDRIAALLPRALRGTYRRKLHGTLG